jgi:hypothetical protein
MKFTNSYETPFVDEFDAFADILTGSPNIMILIVVLETEFTTEYIMRTIFLLAITAGMLSILQAKDPGKLNPDSLGMLQKEVAHLFEKNSLHLDNHLDQIVTVGFIINAKNEIIITDVTGDSDDACAFVKEVLNYKKLKFNRSKQLTRYSVTIHLVPVKK